MKTQNYQPWINEHGEPLSSRDLRKLSKNWDFETWREYAATLEDGRSEHLAHDFEDLLRKHDREEALHNYLAEEYGECTSNSPEFDLEPNAFAKALSQLSYLEREVLFLCFWEGRTEREIAADLEHTRAKVRRVYNRAVRKLRQSRPKNKTEPQKPTT